MGEKKGYRRKVLSNKGVKCVDASCYSGQIRAILNTTDYLVPSFKRFLKSKHNYYGGDLKRWDVVQTFFHRCSKRGLRVLFGLIRKSFTGVGDDCRFWHQLLYWC